MREMRRTPPAVRACESPPVPSGGPNRRQTERAGTFLRVGRL